MLLAENVDFFHAGMISVLSLLHTCVSCAYKDIAHVFVCVCVSASVCVCVCMRACHVRTKKSWPALLPIRIVV